MVTKQRDGEPEVKSVPSDTTKPLVDLLNEYQADLFITSGHATERNWQIGYRYKNGYFISKAGQLMGVDTEKKKHPVTSPNPKVYLPIGNCLMGHIDGADSMALAWMNSAGVHQMVGYTVETWFGYGGWGCLDYFVEQPGRYTFAEAFYVNHQALLHKLETEPSRGLKFDRDVVVMYGDPAWNARMSERTKAWDQKLEYKDGLYKFTLTGNRGEKTFAPVNMNGAQRGGRPIVELFPQRLTDIQIVGDNGLNPVITDDFILIPLPEAYSEDTDYSVVFKAQSRVGGE
jgi:zinc protease